MENFQGQCLRLYIAHSARREHKCKLIEQMQAKTSLIRTSIFQKWYLWTITSFMGAYQILVVERILSLFISEKVTQECWNSELTLEFFPCPTPLS